MSGDQEPWVFRGGLVADLQVIWTLPIYFYIIFVYHCVYLTKANNTKYLIEILFLKKIHWLSWT